jgi:hypothetical protein
MDPRQQADWWAEMDEKTVMDQTWLYPLLEAMKSLLQKIHYHREIHYHIITEVHYHRAQRMPLKPLSLRAAGHHSIV